jgi:hypothetical protein
MFSHQNSTSSVLIFLVSRILVQFPVLTSFLEMTVFCRQGPDDGGGKLLWNVGQFLPDCTARNVPQDSRLRTRRCENLK